MFALCCCSQDTKGTEVVAESQRANALPGLSIGTPVEEKPEAGAEEPQTPGPVEPEPAEILIAEAVNETVAEPEPVKDLTSGEQEPLTYQVSISKSEGASKIGLDIAPSASKYLKVKKIKEGLVQEWNKQNPDTQVCEGDFIVEVNSVKGSVDDLLSVIARDVSLTLVLQRTLT